MPRKHLPLIAALVACLLASVGSLNPANAAKLVGSPVYHAPSGSYFALAYELAGRDGLNWNEAKQRAERMTYKGRSGRLAVVDDVSKHKLVTNNFKHSREAWLGLRYWCQARMLAWVDLTPHVKGGFQVWMPKWHRTHIRCGASPIQYMGVYYTVDAQLWQAAGESKHFPYFFVEFPASDAQSDAAAAGTPEPAE
jgi:hypothetical protein